MTEPILGGARIVPVVVLDDADSAQPLAEALLWGGLPVAEVTFRTPAAEVALRRMAAVPGLLVGAGTVVSASQVDVAVEAGARFIVSPGLSRAVVERAQQHGVPVFPGVATATELMSALELGLRVVKFFPAETLGGVAALKAIAAPFPGVRFVPTGGITAATAGSYLALPYVAAIGGSWMVTAQLVASGKFDEVERLAAEAVAASGGEA
jgi:2-dehydro-3-deoxyphosphogluconate aldolase / (4S)-4-hydroxy-2-oxoglutarate aldolase